MPKGYLAPDFRSFWLITLVTYIPARQKLYEKSAYCTFFAQFPLQRPLHNEPLKQIFCSITPEKIITDSLWLAKTEEEFTFFKGNFIKTIYNKILFAHNPY